jgi:hypothetical protein
VDETSFNGMYYKKKDGRKHQTDLTLPVLGRMFKTPTAQMYRHTGKGELNRKYIDSTARDVAKRDPQSWIAGGGQLNPTWVEWLMGFPIEFTVLSASETPSFRKSRKQ